MRNRKSNRSGFTLIELLLVLVILAVLAALVIPKFANRSQQARETAAKTDLSTIASAISQFEIDTGRYPTSEEGLNALMAAPNGVQGWHGPYLSKVPKDPWGTDYVYRFPGSTAAGFDVLSYGVDRAEGTDDITNQ